MARQVLGEILVAEFSIDRRDVAHALKLQEKISARIGELLLNAGIITEEQIASALAIQFNMQEFKRGITDSTRVTFTPLEQMDPAWFIQNGVLPLFAEDSRMHFVITDPLNLYPREVVSRFYGDYDLAWFIADERRFRDLISRFTARHITEEEESSLVDIEKLRDLAGEAPVIKFVNSMVSRAAEYRASDIHLENRDGELKIRYRIDGVLQDIDTVSSDMGPAVLSRVKIISNLDIGEKRLPQDGRMQLKVSGKFFDIRVSTIPTIFGENIVLRLLEKQGIRYTIDTLGLIPEDIKRIRRFVQQNFGLVLITGPTGSGKSTTLYSLLNELDVEQHKIITVEDPVEYQIPDITQIQVHEQIGLSFASILRNVLRHDPDIIMIGEIRDRETAEIAIHSALTGHLVMATLHTNDSVSAITRLIDMGVEDYLINSSLIGVVAQRLARRICPDCAAPISLDRGAAGQADIKRVLSQFAIDSPVIRTGKGCETCAGTGFYGRIGVFEILSVSDRMKTTLLKSKDYESLRRVAKTEGLKTLRDDAIIKYLKGVTSYEEVFRIT